MEQLRPYVELGFNHLVFHAPGNDQARFLKLYGSTILPRIRERWDRR
jgi:coenzyme F420-dependent glucose-6-phosphate dehydrogenase